MIKSLLNKNSCTVFDGAMGTMLMSAGLPAGEMADLYNLRRPDLVEDIHRAYLEAGAEVITTNTFQANEEKLAGSGYSVDTVIAAGVALARQAGAKVVALSVGPLAGLLQPLGEISFDRAYQLYRQQVLAGVGAGADLVLIETQADLGQAKAAILAAKENSDLPVFCTLTFQEDGRTFMGADPVSAVLALQGLGADGLGANCSLGPRELKPLVKKMLDWARVPLLVKANAGLPCLETGKTLFPVGPREFAEQAREMASLGVAALGGCCGTTPAHIACLRAALAGVRPGKARPRQQTAASSPLKVVSFSRGTLVGEGLNPTGNRELKESLRKGDLTPWLRQGIAQVQAGASALDVNVGLPGTDEKNLLLALVARLQAVLDTPLMLDSADPAALAAAARIYRGKPVLNSVSGREESLTQVLPVAKKYGAAVVGLTIDEEGIPETAEKRLAIAEKILTRALDLGIPQEDLIIDCLTFTAAVQPEQAAETLKAIGLVQDKLGLATILGISNISHGLPRRGRLNAVFLAQALAAGLDAAIADPLSREVQDTLAAWRVLSGKDQGGKQYIQMTAPSPLPSREMSLPALIARGDKEGVAAGIARLLEHKKPRQVLQDTLIPALEAVGREYEKGRIYLPQLLQAAEAVKEGLAVLKKTGAALGPSRGLVVLASVQGDIHDIGKNIAKLLLENQGFAVFDLGKDVPAAAIVAAAKDRGAKLVGLSALMTTTLASMAETIAALKREVPGCQVMVGGAVLTEEYARKIGADFYAPDALAGVNIADRVCQGDGVSDTSGP
jgi:5-methyltetrahydrofolate--homocysteine methyltransferase